MDSLPAALPPLVLLNIGIAQVSAIDTHCFSCHKFMGSYGFNFILNTSHSFVGMKFNSQMQVVKN